MDFRKLNHVTVKDSYQIPRIDESTLHLCFGYYIGGIESGGELEVCVCGKRRTLSVDSDALRIV